MLRTLTSLLAALICIHLGACASVTTTHLLGEPIDDAQGAQLTGAWKGQGEALIFAHYLGEGKVQVGSTKWDEATKQLKVDQDTAFVRKLGGAMILHMVDQADDEGDGSARTYSISRLVLTESGDLIYMPPDVSAFAAAVKKGDLKGEATGSADGEKVQGFAASESKTVRLAGSKDEIDAYLTAERIPLLFTFDGSGVLSRLDGIDMN